MRAAVAAADVEADPAAVEVPAHGLARVALLREVRLVHILDAEHLAVHSLAHELMVEGALAAGAVDEREVSADVRGARNAHLAATLLPEEEFKQALCVPQRQGSLVVVRTKDPAPVIGDAAVRPLQGYREVSRGRVIRYDGLVRAIPQCRRKEEWVEWRRKKGNNLLHERRAMFGVGFG